MTGNPENPTGEAAPTSSDPDDEAIDEIGVESFPASDSPSSWSGRPSDPK